MKLSKETDSYNASGVFLQTFVANELKKLGWNTEIEHHVVVAPFRKNPTNENRDLMGTRLLPTIEKFLSSVGNSQNSFALSERSIDVVATREIDGNRRIHLCIECKKQNPDYTEWCFFDEMNDYRNPHVIIKSINPESTILFDASVSEHERGISLSLNQRYIREWKFWPEKIGDYGLALNSGKLKGEYYITEQTIVDKACIQIIEGTYGLTIEYLISDISSEESPNPITDIFVPIVITNTNLKFCEFNRDWINPEKGHLTEEPTYIPLEAIFYQYNSPKSVQYPQLLTGNLSMKDRSNASKWYVVILSPKGLTKFLASIDKMFGPVDVFHNIR